MCGVDLRVPMYVVVKVTWRIFITSLLIIRINFFSPSPFLGYDRWIGTDSIMSK